MLNKDWMFVFTLTYDEVNMGSTCHFIYSVASKYTVTIQDHNGTKIYVYYEK